MAQDHARANVLPRVASILSMLDQLGLFPLISSHTTLFNLPVRRSERIKRQEMGGMKIADKAHMAARKKNLEGNNLSHKNSFAVLDTLTYSVKWEATPNLLT
jgi:hypothetical protein